MAVYPDTDGLRDLGAELAARHQDTVLDASVALGELTVRITLAGLVPLVRIDYYLS